MAWDHSTGSPPHRESADQTTADSPHALGVLADHLTDSGSARPRWFVPDGRTSQHTRQNLLFSCQVLDPQLDFFHTTMPRARAGDHQRQRPKATLIEELTRGINRFQELLTAIHDFGQDGFPYRDAAQSKAELQFRECLRQTFGERSQEFQTYRNFKIRTGNKDETGQSIATIKGLLHILEDRKLELQGLKPAPKPDPAPEPPQHNTARLVLVSPATPSTGSPHTTAPITVAVAMTTNVGPTISPTSPMPPVQPPAATPQPQPPTPAPMPTSLPPMPPPIPTVTVNPTLPTLSSTPIPTSPALPIPPAQTPPPVLTPVPAPPLSSIPAPALSPQIVPEPPAPPIAVAPPPPPLTPVVTPAAQPTALAMERPVPAPHMPPSPMVAPASPSQPSHPHIDAPTPATITQSPPSAVALSVVRPIQEPPSDKPSIGEKPGQVAEPTPDQDPLQLIRKVCLRFHSVVRQLRLRKDYRPTLEVDDDYDLQDLLCALLKVEFDEVATDEWTPPYTEGASRTTLLVNKDQIAIVAKKTRPGLTTKDLTDQVTADSAYYRAQGRCSTLFCFMYDPEGRIGSPKRLETTLTSVSEHCRIEVLVAPK